MSWPQPACCRTTGPPPSMSSRRTSRGPSTGRFQTAGAPSRCRSDQMICTRSADRWAYPMLANSRRSVVGMERRAWLRFVVGAGSGCRLSALPDPWLSSRAGHRSWTPRPGRLHVVARAAVASIPAPWPATVILTVWPYAGPRGPVARRAARENQSRTVRRHAHDASVTSGTTDRAGKLTAVQLHDTMTARRAYHGSPRLGQRDIDGLSLCAEHYGAPYDLLAAALGVQPARLRGIVARWRRAGYAATGRLCPGPAWCWPDPGRHGRGRAGLPRPPPCAGAAGTDPRRAGRPAVAPGLSGPGTRATPGGTPGGTSAPSAPEPASGICPPRRSTGLASPPALTPGRCGPSRSS